MFSQTPQSRVLFPPCAKAVLRGVILLFRHRVALSRKAMIAGMALITTVILLAALLATSLNPKPAQAATQNTINFQARLQTNTGALVADGFYNVQFKLYDAPTVGTNLWTETYYDSNGVTAGNDNRVRVQNGYLSVPLGSQTGFPGTINWDQQLYLTMNIGGVTQTATPTYDGEMTPRLALTAVPYAFRAGQLVDNNGSFTSLLDFTNPTANRSILLPDEGGTLCIQSSVNCGFALTTGSGSYIQNSTSPQATSNFNISGTGVAGTSLQAPTIYASTLDTATAVPLNIGTTNATVINLNENVAVASGKTLTLNGNSTFNGTISASNTTSASLVGINSTINSSGANTSPAAVYGTLNDSATTASSTGLKYAGQFVFNKNGSAADTGYENGALYIGANINAGSSTNIWNIESRIQLATGATVTNAYDFVADSQYGTGGTVTNRVGLDVKDFNKAAGQTLTTQYGVKIENLTTGASNYSIYTGTAQSYFGGAVTTSAGINNNNAGITSAGAIAGVTTLAASSTVTGSQLVSTVATGTAPLTVASTTKVTNLNADLLDGLDSTAFATSSGSGNYIQNGLTPQTANFNITGDGTIGGSLSVTGGINNNSGGIIGTGAVSGVTSLTANGNISTTGSITGASLTVGNTANQVLTISSGAGNHAIETGRTDGVASTPFVDFHSGATATDYDARIIASGGTGANGGGTLSLTAATTNVTGNLQTNGTQRLSSAGVLGNITGYTQTSGNATFNQNAADQLKVVALQAPTSDLVNISNAGQPVTVANTNGLQIDYYGGAAAVEASGARFNITPGTTSGGTWNALRVVAGTATSGVSSNGIKLETTAGTGSQNGLYFGTGWDSLINYNGTTILDGTGILQSAAFTGTYAGAVTMSNASNSFTGVGTGLTALNATNLGSGTVNTARIAGSYTGITAVGTLSSLTVSGGFNNSSGGIIGAGSISGATTITASGNVQAATLTSTVATGTAPLTVASTTKVTNLNADLLDGMDSTAFALAGSGSYIQNTTSPQATSNFNISGTGIAGVELQTPLIDTATAVALNIGTTNATVINLNENVTVAAGKNLTFTAGAGNFDQSASTGTFATGTGAVALNGNTTVAAGKSFTANGTALFKNSVNSTTAFQVQNAAGAPIFLVDTTSSNYLSNPGFETGVSGWAAVGSAAAPVQNLTIANTYHGVASLQETTTAVANDGVRVSSFTTTPTFATSATWNFSFYAKTSVAMTTLQAGYNVGAGDTLCTITSSTTITTGFQRFSCTITLTTGQSIASIFIRQSDAVSRTMYIDAAQLITGSSVVPYNIGSIQLRGVVNTPAAFQSATNSVTAFQVQNAAGTNNNLLVDTVNNIVYLSSTVRVANGSYGATLNVAGTTISRTTTNNVNAFQVQNSNATPIFGVDTTASAANLINNPGFEAATTGWANKTGGTLTRITTPATALYYGIGSGQLAMTGANGGAAFTVALTLGTTYNLSFYARTSTGTATNINVGYTNTGGDVDCLTSQTVVAGGFTRYSCSFTVTGTAGTAIYVKENSAVTETLYLDAFQLLGAGATSATPYSLGSLQLRGVINTAVAFQNATDSTTAFQIQNSAGTSGLLVADTLNGKLSIAGTTSLTGAVTVTTGGLNIQSGGLTVQSGGLNLTGGLNNNNGLITNAGGISGVTTLAASSTVTGSQLVSTVATGTAPLTVASTTKVTNLNADQLDGLDSTAFAAATGSGNYIRNTTTLQSANFSVQAATSGSVAGILQANAAGVGDILQLNNGAGTIVARFTYAGAAWFMNSTNMTNGFQVQNASGVALMNFDTVAGKLTVTTAGGGGSIHIGNVFGSTIFQGITLNGSTNVNEYNLLSGVTDKNLYLNRPNGYDIGFRINNATQMTLTSAGRLGIGTTAPAYALEVANGTVGVSGAVYTNTAVTGAFLFASGAEAAWYDPGTSQFSWGFGGVSNFFGDWVGINTNNPHNALAVVGNIAASGTVLGGVGAPDYAELITKSDLSIEAADVVAIDPNNVEQVIKTSHPYEVGTIGAISTNPGFVTNAQYNATDAGAAERPNQVPLALSGRIPVKVTNENGAVQPGDYLTSSSTPGYAMKATQDGPVIGKAMEAFTGTQGKVLMFIDNTYYHPGAADLTHQISNLQTQFDALGTTINTGTLNATTLSVSGNASIHGNLTVAGITNVGELQLAGHLVTKGEAPTLELQAAAGNTEAVAPLLGAKATITGNDTSGTITLVIGKDPIADRLLKIKFHKVFAKAPQVVLTAVGKDSALMGSYIDDTTTAEFSLGAANQPQSQKTYVFNYHIMQADAE